TMRRMTISPGEASEQAQPTSAPVAAGQPAVRVESLRKSYGSVLALAGSADRRHRRRFPNGQVARSQVARPQVARPQVAPDPEMILARRGSGHGSGAQDRIENRED
ncbi:MAG TPA: hypothetical protein VN767_15560, partial [Streptosporangiaceae bacterium]|nr:hypothetical protein [Streptosporangiaceae bacterium]